MYYEQVADKQLRKSEDAAPISPAANISGMSPGPADLVELEVSTVFSSLFLSTQCHRLLPMVYYTLYNKTPVTAS